MPRTGHYLFGLLMFCVAFAFTMALGSFLQQAAMTRQIQLAAAPSQVESPVVSLLPTSGYPSGYPGSYYRKASF